MADEDKPVVEPASAGRMKREAKKVERLTVESSDKDKDEFKVAPGAGKKFGDIENIVFKISKLNAQSEELKHLHRACFGKPGSKLAIKKNLREFSGLVTEDMAAEKAKKVAAVGKLDLKTIKGMLDTCDLSPGGTKAEAVERLVDFLVKPHDSGKKSLLTKAGEKRKRAEKKKEKAAKSPAKGKAKAKAGAKPKQERAKSAYQLYCDSRREKVKAENPDAGFGELQKIFSEKWKGISDERKAKYEAQAAELKKELTTKQGKPEPTAKPAAKRAKKDEQAEADAKEDGEDGEGEAKDKTDDMEE